MLSFYAVIGNGDIVDVSVQHIKSEVNPSRNKGNGVRDFELQGLGENTDDSSTDPLEEDVGGQFIFTDVDDKVRIAKEKLRNYRRSIHSTQEGVLSLGEMGNDAGFHGELVMSGTSQGVVGGGQPFENSSDPNSRGGTDEEYKDKAKACQGR